MVKRKVDRGLGPLGCFRLEVVWALMGSRFLKEFRLIGFRWVSGLFRRLVEGLNLFKDWV